MGEKSISVQATTMNNSNQTQVNVSATVLSGSQVTNTRGKTSHEYVLNQKQVEPKTAQDTAGYGDPVERVQSPFSEHQKHSKNQVIPASDVNSKNYSGLGMHKTSHHINRLPNSNFMHLDDQETDKQTVYLTTQNNNPNGIMKREPHSKYSQSFRLNGNTAGINTNNLLLAEEHEIKAGAETVSNSFDKDQQLKQFNQQLANSKKLSRRHKCESFKVP